MLLQARLSRQAREAVAEWELLRHVEGERRPDALLALDGDRTTEQPRNLAADRQAEAGAAVLAAGRAVGLLERLEDVPQFVGCDSDPGVGDREREDGRLRVVQRRYAEAQRAVRGVDPQRDAAGVGELERVGQQVAQH